MKLRVIALIGVILVALPATSVAGSTSLNNHDVSLAQENPGNETETTTPDSSDSANSDSSEYTKLYVESDYNHPELKPGESTEFTVTVTNREDSTVTLNPHVYVPPVGENLVEKSWVTIDGDSTVAAGEETEFTVTVSVPESAETGHYSGQVAFTDETVTYPGRPARPVHATSVHVRVWKQPMVNIVSSTYLNGEVEAGDTITKQIVIKNTGDQAVPLSPQLQSDRNRVSSSSSSKIDPAWLDIEAPSSVESGETATVSVTISPPENTDNNRYRGNLDLGLKDPNRDGTSNYWQRISLNINVWNQPSEAYETSFDVSEDTENVTLTLSPQSAYSGGSDSAAANFDVTLVKPDGTTVTAERVQVTDRGFVGLSNSNSPNAQQQGEYAVRNGGQEFVYRIDDPEAGSWDLQVLPENVIGFSYEITRSENAQ